MNKIYLTAAVFAVMFGARSISAQTPVSAPADAGTSQADDQAAAELREHHRHHHHGGVTQFIAMSLDTLGAAETKRPKIEKIQRDLHACLASAGKVEKNVLKTIADGVDAGTIDATKVDTTIDQLGTAAAGTQLCSVKALNKLHAVLSPIERQALVDKVQAHWQVWRQVNHKAEFGGKERGGRLAELAKELALTPDQVEKISAQLHAAPDSDAGKFNSTKAEEHVQSFATAFAGESFDAKTIMANANGDLATHGAKRMARFYETVTPLLTPEQRTTLAKHLREHAGQQPSST